MWFTMFGVRIVKNGTAARQTPHDGNVVLRYKGMVDLGIGVLIFSDHDGRLVLPEHKNVVGLVREQILLYRKIKVRIVTF